MPNKFLSKFNSLIELTRIKSTSGFLLSFFPASFGTMLAYETTENFIYLLIFFIGSILVRSSGCIINDLIDQDIDRKVERTKNRPIASGKITNIEAIIFLIILLAMSLSILLFLNTTSIIIGTITAFLITLYPLMKRFTYFPQVFLGITFNTGCLIGYSAIKDNISFKVFILYIACAFWTVAYDTIYGFMDIKDDKKIGVKSTAIFFEDYNFKLIIASLYITFLTLFTLVFIQDLSLISIFSILIISYMIYWIVAYLDINDPKNCMKRFKINNYIGFILFLTLILEKL